MQLSSIYYNNIFLRFSLYFFSHHYSSYSNRQTTYYNKASTLWKCNYKNKTECCLAVFFILSTGYCLGFTHVLIYSDVNSIISAITITKYVNFTINVIIPGIVTTAYIYILCFVRRHSNVVSHYKHGRNKVNKELTKTIMYLAIYQTICGVPYLVFRVTDMLREGYTVKFFFTVSGSFHETWNTFMK